jgi:2'-5' RNA ligase superfamily
MPRRTALVVLVPEADAYVDPTTGVPAHVTVLFPFAPRGSFDRDELASLLAAHAAFEFELASVERFPGAVTYLAPVPAAPFEALTEAVWRRWPEHPPYESAHDVVVPHLTLSLEHVEPDVALPIHAGVREVALLEEDEAGRWHAVDAFPLYGVE